MQTEQSVKYFLFGSLKIFSKQILNFLWKASGKFALLLANIGYSYQEVDSLTGETCFYISLKNLCAHVCVLHCQIM